MGGSIILNCSLYSDDVYAPNPNPLNFYILYVEEINDNLIAKIKYPDCINFEGMKICLFKNMKIKDLLCLDSIDPHFSEDSKSPFARFRPDKDGLDAARKIAKVI